MTTFRMWFAPAAYGDAEVWRRAREEPADHVAVSDSMRSAVAEWDARLTETMDDRVVCLDASTGHRRLWITDRTLGPGRVRCLGTEDDAGRGPLPANPSPPLTFELWEYATDTVREAEALRRAGSTPPTAVREAETMIEAVDAHAMDRGGRLGHPLARILAREVGTVGWRQWFALFGSKGGAWVYYSTLGPIDIDGKPVEPKALAPPVEVPQVEPTPESAPEPEEKPDPKSKRPRRPKGTWAGPLPPHRTVDLWVYPMFVQVEGAYEKTLTDWPSFTVPAMDLEGAVKSYAVGRAKVDGSRIVVARDRESGERLGWIVPQDGEPIRPAAGPALDLPDRKMVERARRAVPEDVPPQPEPKVDPVPAVEPAKPEPQAEPPELPKLSPPVLPPREEFPLPERTPFEPPLPKCVPLAKPHYAEAMPSPPPVRTWSIWRFEGVDPLEAFARAMGSSADGTVRLTEPHGAKQGRRERDVVQDWYADRPIRCRPGTLSLAVTCDPQRPERGYRLWAVRCDGPSEIYPFPAGLAEVGFWATAKLRSTGEGWAINENLDFFVGPAFAADAEVEFEAAARLLEQDADGPPHGRDCPRGALAAYWTAEGSAQQMQGRGWFALRRPGLTGCGVALAGNIDPEGRLRLVGDVVGGGRTEPLAEAREVPQPVRAVPPVEPPKRVPKVESKPSGKRKGKTKEPVQRFLFAGMG